ncbi:hypothetical protein Tco_1349341, partial [Tanacetum coccineum]
IVPAFPKELIYRVLGLQVLFLRLNRFGILLGEREVSHPAEAETRGVTRIDIVSPKLNRSLQPAKGDSQLV